MFRNRADGARAPWARGSSQTDSLHAQAEFKQAAKAAYEAPSPAMAQALRENLVDRYGATYPTAVKCFEEDFEACIAHLRCPPAHRKVIRTTNLLERLFREERRRLKAVGTIFGERPVLKLMFGVLGRVSDGWRGVTLSDIERKQLETLRDEQKRKERRATAPIVATTTPSKRLQQN